MQLQDPAAFFEITGGKEFLKGRRLDSGILGLDRGKGFRRALLRRGKRSEGAGAESGLRAVADPFFRQRGSRLGEMLLCIIGGLRGGCRGRSVCRGPETRGESARTIRLCMLLLMRQVLAGGRGVLPRGTRGGPGSLISRPGAVSGRVCIMPGCLVFGFGRLCFRCGRLRIFTV